MKPVDEARAFILEAVGTLPAETAFVGDASGRVLAGDVASLRNLPPHDNSAMDGYGLKAADIVAASDDRPVALKVTGAVLAGMSVTGRPPLEDGCAVRIMTGAPVPPGVDTVCMRELTDESGVEDGGGGTVLVKRKLGEGEAIRRQGEDVGKDSVIATAGTPITPARINLLASAGHVVIRVHRRPTVAILASGDELRELGTPAGDDDIVNSNAHAIAAQVRAAGGEPRMLGIAADTLEDHTTRVKGAAFADVLITIGGVSVGTHDFVRPALEAAGAELDFWKVAMRPGKPLAFGRRGEQVIFGLPGNPVSSQVSFELFVRPALLRMQGRQDCVRRAVPAKLVGEGMKKRPGVAFYARATASVGETGVELRLQPKQGSGQISGLAAANALCVIPAEREAVADGDLVHALLLDDSAYMGA